MSQLRNVHISKIVPFRSPLSYWKELPANQTIENFVVNSRRQIIDILLGEDPRLLCVVGPCSIDDEDAGLEYAFKLAELSRRLRHRLFIVMRAYFEKPRTGNDWKGLLSQPGLNNDFDLELGVYKTRKFLLELAKLGLPAAVEVLDSLIPEYIADLVSWAAIGARSVQYQGLHNVASGLSMPVGFKNSTAGDVQAAVDAISKARFPQTFPGQDRRGRAAVIYTTGNPDCHVVLRGGDSGPNYDVDSVKDAMNRLKTTRLRPIVMVDCSHGNSQKDIDRQVAVCHDVLRQRSMGNKNIIGIMLESNLLPGSQKLNGNGSQELKHGISKTDPCIGWDQTVELLEEAHRSLGSVISVT